MDDGSGNSPDERADNGGPLRKLRRWGGQTRRRFVMALVATVTGVATATVLDTETVLDTTTNQDDTTEVPPRDAHVQEHEDGYRAVYADGTEIASGPDGWAVLDSAVNSVPSGGTVQVRGNYHADSPLEIDDSIRLDGHGASIELDASARTVFDIRGEERHQTELAADASTGDYTLELADGSGIQPGDLVLLEKTGGEPLLGRGQPPGEPHSVLEVDGGTVAIEDTVVWREGYGEGTLVYVVDPIEVHCSGFEMTAPAKDESYIGIIALDCRDSVFEELRLENFGNRGIAVGGCANSRIRDCTVLQSADIDAANGYGIQVRAGCHDVLVEGCSAKECRHPFSITPAGPREVASRSVTVRDGFFSADGSAALNCHGGSAHDIKFVGCTVHTWGKPGVRTGAQKTNVSGCEFRMNGHHAITTRNDGQEMVLTVTDTDIYGATNAVGLSNEDGAELAPVWKLAHLDGVRAHDCNRLFQLESGRVGRVRTLTIRNCSWDTVGDVGIRIENRLDGGAIENNSFGDAPNDSHIRILGSDSAVTNLRIGSNQFRDSSGPEPIIRLANATQCVISDNTFHVDRDLEIYLDDENATGNVIKQNTYFGNGNYESAINHASGSTADENYFMGDG